MLLNKQRASVGGHCQWNMRSKACIHIEKTKTIVPLWFVNQHVSVLAIPKVMNDISKSIFGKSISTFSCTSCIWMKMPFFYFSHLLSFLLWNWQVEIDWFGNTWNRPKYSTPSYIDNMCAKSLRHVTRWSWIQDNITIGCLKYCYHLRTSKMNGD